MACEEFDLCTDRAPLFDGTKYTLWSIRMKICLMALGSDIWDLVMTSYTTPKTPPTNVAAKESRENNKKAMDAILSSLPDSLIVKVKKCTSAKKFGTSYKTFMEDLLSWPWIQSLLKKKMKIIKKKS